MGILFCLFKPKSSGYNANLTKNINTEVSTF